MAKQTVLKVNDTGPPFLATLRDGNGDRIDLAGATAIRVLMRRNFYPQTVKVAAAATVLGDPRNGDIRYEWAPGDVDEPGSFQLEVEVTFGTGEVVTWPNGTYHRVRVREDVDG